MSQFVDEFLLKFLDRMYNIKVPGAFGVFWQKAMVALAFDTKPKYVIKTEVIMELLIKILLVFSFAFSLLFKLLNYLTFYRLYKASNNMSGSGLDIIKQIKRRFSDCITLGKPMENTESYIRRILLSSNKYNTTGTLRERISIGFLLVFWGILWFGYINDFFSYENTVLCTVISLVLVYITDRLFDTCAMESGFITYAADYLDNTIKCRLQKANYQRTAENPHRNQMEMPEADTASSIQNQHIQNNKKSTPLDKSALEMAAAVDTELITSIIDEFIL